MITYKDILSKTQGNSLYSKELNLVLEDLDENIKNGNFSSNHTTYLFRPAFEVTTKIEYTCIHKGKSLSWHETINIAGNSISNISFTKDLKALLSKTYKNVEVSIFKKITPNEAQNTGIEFLETVVISIRLTTVSRRSNAI